MLRLLLRATYGMCFPRLMGSTTFKENSAYEGGAIYTDDGSADEAASVTTFPDDTVFEDNNADVRT